MRQERARGEQETAMLREAAANDLATARAHHAAEMAAVAAERQVALPTPLTPRTPLPPSSSTASLQLLQLLHLLHSSTWGSYYDGTCT